MKVEVPRKAERFLEWICPDYLFEGIAGDIEEQYFDDLENFSQLKANRRYWCNVVRFARPGIVFRNKLKITHSTMINNYLKVAGRNMARRKLFSFINAFGLSIGLAFCILIYLFIEDENSFDKFHADSHSIFRIEEKAYNLWRPDNPEKYNYSAYLQTGLAPAIKNEVPQVEYATRFNPADNAIFTYEDKVFTEEVSFVDPDFFKMFSFPIISGSTEGLLVDKYQIVITPKIAKKYFASVENALGKTVTINYWNEDEFTVAGIIEEPPSNSSLQFDILMNQENRAYYESNMDQWNNFNTPTFVKLKANADMTSFHGNLQLLADKYMGESLERWIERYDAPEDVLLFEYQYKNLEDIHLDTQVSWAKSSDPQYSYILGGISILILLIACINYIALALTTSASRKTEVGIRKVVGAQRGQLVNQFVFESILTAFISMILGLLLVILFLPFFNEFTSKDIEITTMQWFTIIGVAVGLSSLVGLVAGSYPAFFISGFKPISALKSGFTSNLKAGFTKPLVVLQFALSTFLIISTIIMYQQMNYITSKDLGFDDGSTLVLPTQQGWNEKSNRVVEQLRLAFEKVPTVEQVAGVSSSFNQGWSRNGYQIDGEQKVSYIYTVDPYYAALLDIEIIAGRNFDPDRLSDSSAIIVNEALVEDMGWDDPTSEYLNWREDSTSLGSKVIGVAKNYHFLSLEKEIKPVLLTMKNGYLINALVKLSGDDLPSAISDVEKTWKELYPNKPFDYSFLDEDIQRQYGSYERWMSIMQFSTVFAILISCLGLFGLSGINALNRTKEIGIRKVFGANVHTIYMLLNRQYIWLTLIAFTLAVPASWYIMDQWIADFEYSITLNWQLFAVSLIVGLFVAIVTVTYHAIAASNKNPASTLKYE